MKYLLFDLDGTLTDPKEGITRCFQYALEEFNIYEEDVEKLTWIIGPPLMDSFMQGYGFTKEQAERATAKYRERYIPIGWKENKLYPDIPEVLAKLKEAGYVIALATSKPQDMARKILEHFDLAKYFTFIGGASMDLSRARKEEVIEYVLQELKVVDRNEVLMIGDRKYDILGAKQTGLHSLGVLYGYGDREELETAGADEIAETVGDIFQKILIFH